MRGAVRRRTGGRDRRRRPCSPPPSWATRTPPSARPSRSATRSRSSRLLECSLELLDGELLVALQDLGAAGLTSSASEMVAKGGVGIDLDVRRVPLREADMEPFEIIDLRVGGPTPCVVEPTRVDDVLAVCRRLRR